MFTATAHKNLASAKEYHSQHLRQNDYYAAGEIEPGYWIGQGAERLRLKDDVTDETFVSLCENKNPETSERLTQRQQKEGKRRIFYDFTCSAPKSVSVLAVTLDDRRLLQAHEEAVRIAFRELETFAATRVRKPNIQKDRRTENLVAAAFTHDSSRALDPQLHTHFTVFNATYDAQEKCWKALEARGMYEAIRYGTAVYRNELARRVQEIGYRIVPAKHGFEIEGVSREVLKRFSKRAQQRDAVIKEMEEKLGRRLSNNEISHAVHRSRAKKAKGISTAAVRERQLAELSPEDRQSLENLRATIRPGRLVQGAIMTERILGNALQHVFERRSVVPDHELLNVALSQRPGEVNLEHLKNGLKHWPNLIRTERGLTTREILATELSLIKTVNASCDSVEPLHPGYRPADWLGEDQRRAIYHILRTTDRITGLKGLAGTGKTTALKELVTACQLTGLEPLFCAPTAAATDVLRKEGFAAKTLQSLLFAREPLAANQLIVLDEAGAVGMDDMKRLFELAKNNRILLSGDSGQHTSVARGDALRILERHSRFQSGQLSAIRRQRRAEYRKVVELAAQQRTTEAFVQLERMKAVTEVPMRHSELHEAVARTYSKALESNKSVLMVAPTWNEIEAVTEKVRDALKAAGRLTGKETEVQVFDSFSWTNAQKRDVRQYRAGMEIHFHRSTRGFAKNESVAVIAAANDALKVRRADGSERVLPLGTNHAGFDVGEKRPLKLAQGDRLLLQANAVIGRKRFINGELVEIKRLAGNGIVLTDGRIIPANYRTFTHGYAVTSHASQGKTVDEVLLVASARSLPAVNREQFYVSISRGRERCQIFTDDRDALRLHVTESSVRLAAIEAGSENFIQTILQWGNRFLQQFHQRVQQVPSPDIKRNSQTVEPSSYEQRKSTGIRV